jgi:ribosomal RNA-processing protein 17
VTGFRRRKQQRRKEAVKSLEKLQRENKLEERAERREARREQYDLGDNNESANTSTKNGGENPNNMEQVFYGCDTRSTVKISVIPTAFEEEGVKQITSQLDLTTGSNTKHAKIDQQKRGRAGHKLSKTALAVLSNTKLKIEGKRKFSASSGKKNTKSTGSSQGKERARNSRK